MKKHLVISGAGRGIGLALARLALEKNYRVTALVRTATPELEALTKSPECTILPCDVSKADDILRVKSELGDDVIDVLVNNAGMYPKNDDDFASLDLDGVRLAMETNFIAPMAVTQALLPAVLKSEDPRVAHVTSLMGSIADNGSGGSYGYRTSKAALNMFNKSFAADHDSLISLVLHPGWVKTRMGGEQAPTPPEESARGMLGVIENAKASDTGKFFDFEGDEIPW